MRPLVGPLVGPLPVSDELRDRRGRGTCWRWAAALGAGALVLLALVKSGWTPLRSADRSVSDGLHSVAVGHPGWTHANRILTDWVWDPVTMRILALAAIVFLVVGRAPRLALWIAATSAFGAAVQSGVKLATSRARPHFRDAVDSASGWAFPSGHAMTATVVCGLLLMLFLLLGKGGTRARAAAWGVAVVSVAGVGLTRVFLGVHWWTDVVAGWLLGGAVLAVCSGVFLPWRGIRS